MKLENWTYDFVIIDKHLDPANIVKQFDISVSMCFIRRDNIAESVYPQHLNDYEMKLLKKGDNNGKRITKYKEYGFTLID